VIAPLGQAQFVETYLLSVIGHQSVIASKAVRVVQAAQGKPVVDFGTRRAHGREAAVLGARAAFIAGCTGTSNVLAGMLFGIPVVGTQAHAWVQSFPTELDAFRAYAATYPDNNTLLIDTYDIAEGTRHAAQVGKELQENGHTLGGVRIDSGDLGVEIPRVRKILDQKGQKTTKIVVSNDLNEYKIGDLAKQGPDHMADLFGVGTEMIVSRDDPALSVVYKLVEIDGQPCIKLSSGKVTYPGRKQVFRTKDGDVLAAGGEDLPGHALLQPILVDGALVSPLPRLAEIQQYCLDAIKNMPKPLAVTPSPKLAALVETLKAKYARAISKPKGKKRK
jgi:nicotinate phosphoribosyltransferase